MKELGYKKQKKSVQGIRKWVYVRDSEQVSLSLKSVQPVSNPCPTFASLKPHGLTEVSNLSTYIPYKDIFYKKRGIGGV